MLLPAKNADCSEDTSFLITYFNLVTSTLERTLVIQPIRLIGLKSENSMGSFTLGIKAINEDVHLCLNVAGYKNPQIKP
ncbi:hypothetical protein Hanom_Chr07g00588711 [Helianthus anomalus]